MFDQQRLNALADLLRSAATDIQVLPDGSAVMLDLERHRVLTFSHTGLHVFELLQRGLTNPHALVADFASSFSIDQGRAEHDVALFLAELEEVLARSVDDSE